VKTSDSRPSQIYFLLIRMYATIERAENESSQFHRVQRIGLTFARTSYSARICKTGKGGGTDAANVLRDRQEGQPSATLFHVNNLLGPGAATHRGRRHRH
jgi:hypothetical protein